MYHNKGALLGAALGAILALGSPAMNAVAGPAETALLQGYVGQYTGRGQLKGPSGSESVACRLGLTGGGQRLRYSGRCVIAGETVPLSGSISYSDSRDRYEASASGMGTVAGRKRGNGVSFTLSRDYRRSGQSGTFNVSFTLSGGAVAIDLAVADRANGALRANVPLSRR